MYQSKEINSTPILEILDQLFSDNKFNSNKIEQYRQAKIN